MSGPGVRSATASLEPEIVTGGEQRAGAGEDDHPDLVVALRLQEGVAELDQQAPVLGVPGAWTRLRMIRAIVPSSSSSYVRYR